MRRALVIHPFFPGPGGANCVAAWMIQALRHDFEVTLAGWGRFDPAALNEAFGTDLRAGDFRFEPVPAWWRAAQACSPLRLALLRIALTQRHARRLLARERFDVVVGAVNELDLGRRAVQYVHYPWAYFPRPDADYRWYHPLPLLLAYRAGIVRLIGHGGDAGAQRRRMAGNVTLVNSAWTGRRFRAWYGADPRVVYPPVPVDRAPLAWPARTDGFACVGRISPEKRILECIDILARVRRSGHDVTLLICGQRHDAAYERRVLQEAARQGAWVTVALDLPRAALLERVARCRFGIHGMLEEHFGIAVAEMVRLGCVCFAPDDGGAAEVLGDDRRLLYGSTDEAVDRICTALGDAQLLAELRAGLAARAGQYSTEAFERAVRAVCRAVADEAAPVEQAPLRPWRPARADRLG